MLWKAPDFDEDIFDPQKTKRFSTFIYNSNEINNLIDYLDWFTAEYPVCKSIISLLQATAQFRNVTSTDPFLARLRKRNQSEKDLKYILEQMAKELNLAQEKLHQYESQSVQYHLLDSAIHYCLECIRRRKEDLQQAQDELYEHYWHASSLQKLVE